MLLLMQVHTQSANNLVPLNLKYSRLRIDALVAWKQQTTAILNDMKTACAPALLRPTKHIQPLVTICFDQNGANLQACHSDLPAKDLL